MSKPPITDDLHRLVAEHASDLLSVHDAEGRYLWASPSATRLFGWNPEQLVGRSAYELIYPDDLPRVREDHARHEQGLDGHVRYRLRCRDGGYRWVETRSLAHHEREGELRIVCITRDVHDEELERQRARDAEAAMLRSMLSQRLMGLVGGLAHEINNPLSAAFVSLACEDTAPREMRQALRRIRDVVRELGLLAETRPGPPEDLDLAEVIRRVLALMDEERHAIVETDLHPATVWADRGRLYQLIHMLVVVHAPADEPVSRVLLSCEAVDGAAVLRIESEPANAHATVHADLGAAVRGEAPALAVPLQLAEQLAIELRARWESDHTGAKLVTTVAFPPTA